MGHDPRGKMIEDRGPGHTTTDADSGGPAVRTDEDRLRALRRSKLISIGAIIGVLNDPAHMMYPRATENVDRDMVRKMLRRSVNDGKRKLDRSKAPAAAEKRRAARKQ